MKKEKFYSGIFGLSLGLILVSTSMNGQYAFNSTISYAPNEVTVENSKDEVKINTEAIGYISNYLKNELYSLKNKTDINVKGKVTIAVTIAKEGEITHVRVLEKGHKDIEQLVRNIIEGIEKVEPITYDGVAKDKVVWIPLKLGMQ